MTTGQEPRVPPEPPDIKTEAGMLPPGVLMGEPSGLTRGDIAAAIDRLMDKALADGFDRNKLLWPLIYAYRSVGSTAFIEEQEAQRDRLRAALHAKLGEAGEGIGAWVHPADPGGLPGQQRERFYTFRVEDVHAAIDEVFDRAALSDPTPEGEK